MMTTRAILFVFACLLAAFDTSAQTLGGAFTSGAVQLFDNDGDPCDGCKLYAYAGGTTTPIDTFTTSGLATANANPVVLDSAGRASVYLSDRVYKFVLCSSSGSGSTCSGGTTYWTTDNVTAIVPPTVILTKTTNYTVAATDGKDVLVKADASGGAMTVTLYTAVGNAGRVIRVKKIDSSANAVTVDANGSQTIDGQLTASLVSQYSSVHLMSDGANWQVIATSITSGGVNPGTCNGRLTLTSATPVTTADVTAAGTIYFTPYRGNQCALFDGTNWSMFTLTERSLALTVTSGNNYDVFLYSNSGTLTLELASWSSDTARNTALLLQDGAYVKNGTTTRRYVGTLRASGSNTTEDSAEKRFVYNAQNRVATPVRRIEATNTWTYSTAAFQQANATAGNMVGVVQGLAEDALTLTLHAAASNSGGDVQVTVAIGEDSTTVASTSSMRAGSTSGAGLIEPLTASLHKVPAVGYHFYTWLEHSVASGTTTWYGDNGALILQSGLSGVWFR